MIKIPKVADTELCRQHKIKFDVIKKLIKDVLLLDKCLYGSNEGTPTSYCMCATSLFNYLYFLRNDKLA